MRKIQAVILLACVSLFAACGGPEQAASTVQAAPKVQAAPENPADYEIAGIESAQIAPGLSSRVIMRGDGRVAEVGHTAVVHYTGWLYDEQGEKSRGTKFDSSIDRGAHFRFSLGAGRVIKGWDQGVVGMQVGEIRELTIAPEMGYGERGAGAIIPPGSTLVFVVELADLEDVGETN